MTRLASDPDPSTGFKRCRGCDTVKPVEGNFHRHGGAKSDGFDSRCIECRRTARDPENGRRYFQRHKPEATVRVKAWRLANPAAVRAIKKRGFATLRERVFDKLGHKCARCNVTDKRALHFDHVLGGGTQHKRRRPGELFYRDILRAPDGDFQTLCASCNWRKRLDSRGAPSECPRATRQRLKRHEAIAALGGRCPCGEKDIDVLQVDHIHGGGSQERRTLPRQAIYRRAIVVGLAEYQVLCCNCNWIKRHGAPNERPGPKRNVA